MKFLLYLFLFFVFNTIHSHYYLYPIATLNNGKIIFFIKQQSAEHIELIIWNDETKRMESGLWSLFNPAGLQLLPDETGFSFIDNGRLRIKYFNKKSPKTIEFDHYLYGINLINWINPYECYFSAKMGDYYSLFHSFIDGTTSCLIGSNDCNCTYPQKIENQLFYIRETKNHLYDIVQTNYAYDKNKNLNSIVNFYNKPIIFLHMNSCKEGFVIQYDKTLHDHTIMFHYYHIKKIDKNWGKKHLFSFNIPSDLLFYKNKFCLYESLLPLIPRVENNKIYFVDASQNKSNFLEIFVYNTKTSKRRKILAPKNKKFINLFVPIICEGKIIIGGELN